MTQRAMPWLCVCAFTSMASMRICDAMLPALAADFFSTTSQTAMVVSAFALAYGLMQLVYGPVGDRFGKLRVIGAATMLCTAGSVASAVSQDIHWLVTSRVLSGAAAAGIIPLTIAWIGDHVPYENRQAVLAHLLGATVFGMIGGQWLGGLIAETQGWRMAFVLLAAMFFVSGSALLWRFHESDSVQSQASISMGNRMRSVVSSTWARCVLLVVFVEGALVFGVLAFIPSHLHSRFGLTMSEAGAVVALYGVGGLLYSRLASRVLARLGERGLAKWGAAALAFSFTVLGVSGDWGWALPACLLAGFGFYALHNTLQTHATQMAPHARGTGVSLFVCCLFLGQSLGVSVVSQLLKRSDLAIAFFMSAAGVLVLGIAFSQALRQRQLVARAL